MNTIIEKIRAEVTRRKKGNQKDESEYGDGAFYEDVAILSFLSDLEKSEKPSEELEEEIERYLPKIRENPYNEELRVFARYFAQWGAEHRGSSETPKDLESYAQKVEDYYDVGEERGYLCVHRGEVKDAVIAGAKWQAEQDQETIELAEDHAYLAGAVNEREKMMKDAMEGKIRPFDEEIWVEKDSLKGFEDGDKVRIIIVKEDTK